MYLLVENGVQNLFDRSYYKKRSVILLEVE